MSLKTTYRSKRYMDFVKTLECCLLGYASGCEGQVVPHHAGKGGVGLKASDLSCIPLCAYHHSDLHQHGVKSFADMFAVDIGKEVRRANQRYIQYLERK